MKNQQFISRLYHSLGDPHPYVRACAAGALIGVGEKEAGIGALKKIIK